MKITCMKATPANPQITVHGTVRREAGSPGPCLDDPETDTGRVGIGRA